MAYFIELFRFLSYINPWSMHDLCRIPCLHVVSYTFFDFHEFWAQKAIKTAADAVAALHEARAEASEGFSFSNMAALKQIVR